MNYRMSNVLTHKTMRILDRNKDITKATYNWVAHCVQSEYGNQLRMIWHDFHL